MSHPRFTHCPGTLELGRDGDSFDDVPVGVEELRDAVASVCHWPAAMSVFGVFGRMRVVPWSDGVAAPPPPIAALDSDFATSEVPNDFFGSADCLCLRGMYGTRPFSASSLDGPAVLVFDHVPVVVFRHGPILPASRAHPDIGSISMSLSSKIRPCRCREAQAPQEIADRLEPEMTLVHGDGGSWSSSGSWRAAADGAQDPFLRENDARPVRATDNDASLCQVVVLGRLWARWFARAWTPGWS